jgi:hypothetical protein
VDEVTDALAMVANAEQVKVKVMDTEELKEAREPRGRDC